MKDEDAILVEQVSAALEALLKGQGLAEIHLPEAGEHTGPETARLVQCARLLCQELETQVSLAADLNRGDLANQTRAPYSMLSLPLKELKAGMSRLVWQWERLAEGDTRQSLDGMGDFSAVFERVRRAMVERDARLKDLHTQLQGVFEAFPGFINVIDRNYTVRQINPRMRKAYGLEALPDVIGRKCFEVFWGRDTLCEACSVREVFERDATVTRFSSTEEEMTTGKVFKFYASPLHGSKGEVLGAVQVGVDVTDLRETEDALRLARDEAESACRTKSHFLANISHEIRTPMNGILGMTELALGSRLDEESRDYVETAHQSAQSLLRVINDILELAKIEADRLELRQEPMSIPWLLKNVCDHFAAEAERGGNTLRYVLRPGTPTMVIGDSARLRQVLANIVGNALKFTTQGNVLVEARLVEDAAPGRKAPSPVPASLAAPTREYAQILFMIQDTGVGIPLEKAVTIFDSFSQVDPSYARRHSGAGLGLSISKRLLDLMGGHIWVDSEEGEGSLFCFTVRFEIPRDDMPRCEIG